MNQLFVNSFISSSTKYEPGRRPRKIWIYFNGTKIRIDETSFDDQLKDKSCYRLRWCRWKEELPNQIGVFGFQVDEKLLT